MPRTLSNGQTVEQAEASITRTRLAYEDLCRVVQRFLDNQVSREHLRAALGRVRDLDPYARG